MTPKASKPVPAGGVTKHRACDECRSRKLACSKEPDGCSRCKRERIVCHYSPQKPMGRPRKRRPLDEQPSGSPRQRPSSEHETLPPFSGYDSIATPAMAPATFSFLGQQQHDQHHDRSLGFVDVLPNTDTYPVTMSSDPNGFISQDLNFTMDPYSLGFTGEVDQLSSIGYEGHDEEAPMVSKDMSHSLGRYLAAQQYVAPVDPPESIISDMSNSADSPEPLPAPCYKPAPIVTCGCLSSLYLILDELSRLPPDLIQTMRIARKASKVAYSVVNCACCSNSAMLDDPTIPPPIQSYQSMMCLGALIPTACNAYVTILHTIDAETAKAREEGRHMWFSLRDVGGLWGSMAEQPDSCARLHELDNKALDPESWRRTMRAILRLDIHGLDEIQDDSFPRPRQLGLRDIVRLMDERSNKRHEIMDNLIASGRFPEIRHTICPTKAEIVPQEQRSCYRMLDGARAALDSLIIS